MEARPWHKHYPDNILKEIDPSQFNSINELFTQSCEKYSSRNAYINMGSSITYDELDKLSTQFASFLQNQLGLEKGDAIALQMPNILQYPIALFGALKAGLVVVNTNPLYTEHEMKHQFKDAEVKAVVILANFADKLEHILAETEIKHVVVTYLGDLLGWPKSVMVNSVLRYIKKMIPQFSIPNSYSFFEALDMGKNTKLIPQDIKPSDTAFLQYTGGTTGVAKGAVLSHRNIIANMLQVSEWISLLLSREENEIVITPLPLYHIFSLTVNCLTLTNYGATNILITNPKDLPNLIKTLKKYKFTVLTAVNTLFNAIVNAEGVEDVDFSHLKVSVAGGMALQRSVFDRWERLTHSPIIEGYGLTETSPVASCNLPTNNQVGSIGVPVPSTDFIIIDDQENPLGTGQEGELCIKGPQVMEGYYKRPEETTNTFTKDGWFKTGDIAVLREDGFFQIVDRKKDMILVSGFNVYPNEIEEIISEMEKVSEVAAIGVPNEKSGEAVKVCIVAKDPSLTAEEVKLHCREKLTGYKQPRHIEFHTELPKSNVGKILRRKLKDKEQ